MSSTILLHYQTITMSRKRPANVLTEDEGYMSDASSNDATDKRTRSNTDEPQTSFAAYDTPAGKIVTATARVMLGLANKHQSLTKTTISNIIELENEKGSGLQFKKHILPDLQKLFDNVFRYKVVGLPSKKSSSANTQKLPNAQNNEVPTPRNNADDFILVNNLPPSLRALNYSFLADNTKPIENSMKEMESKKSGNTGIVVYGDGLPRPTTNVVQDGIKLLIICVIVLHSNNILQSDLLSVLQKSFGLGFKEKDEISILGDQTIADFISMLSKQEYLERNLIANKSGNGVSKRVLNSKTARYDDNTLVIKLGRRCLEEWTSDEFINLFRQLMQDQWTEQMHLNAQFTVSQIWK